MRIIGVFPKLENIIFNNNKGLIYGNDYSSGCNRGEQIDLNSGLCSPCP